jgi:hypothetical protein
LNFTNNTRYTTYDAKGNPILNDNITFGKNATGVNYTCACLPFGPINSTLDFSKMNLTQIQSRLVRQGKSGMF